MCLSKGVNQTKTQKHNPKAHFVSFAGINNRKGNRLISIFGFIFYGANLHKKQFKFQFI